MSTENQAIAQQTAQTTEKIKQQIAEHPILLYMKGTPQFPQCGFSSQVVQILNGYGQTYSFVNVLENPDIRAVLPQVANWPTFPQLYIQGELIGGCDIVCEMHEEGELQPLIDRVSDSEV